MQTKNSQSVNEMIELHRESIAMCLRMIEYDVDRGRFHWGKVIECHDICIRTDRKHHLYIVCSTERYGPFTYEWFIKRFFKRPETLPAFIIAD